MPGGVELAVEGGEARRDPDAVAGIAGEGARVDDGAERGVDLEPPAGAGAEAAADATAQARPRRGVELEDRAVLGGVEGERLVDVGRAQGPDSRGTRRAASIASPPPIPEEVRLPT